MTQLTETRWTRYGKDRVYVKTADGVDVGHVDLIERTVVAKDTRFGAELQECLARWTNDSEPTPTDLEDSTDRDECRDLADNLPGAAVRAKREDVNAQAPVMNMVARIFGVKTEERSWRVGAKGEEKVAAQLAKLGSPWRVLHAVEVGSNGTDIDHVVIGPPGVFTVNSKRHPRSKAWVGEHRVLVNGHRTDYLRNSRHEAERAARLLSAACARTVDVTAVIAFVDLEDITVKQMPADVHVTSRRGLVRWLRSLPATLDDQSIEEIFAKARLSTTWT